MIEVTDLCKSYHGKTFVLKNLSCSFESGYVYSIIAPNGTGKTTFISILAGLLLPTKGTVHFSGEHSANDVCIVLAGEKNLYVKNTVKENAFYLGRIKGKTTKEITSKTDFLRKQFPVYDEIYNCLVERLSFGQKRLAALLNAVVADSGCIIMDEVSEGLDLTHVSLLMEMINYFKKDRIIILASHDYEFVADISDFNWFLKDGFFLRKCAHLSKDLIIDFYNELYSGGEA